MRTMWAAGLLAAVSAASVQAADSIYFSATDATNGREPWIIPSSSPGTARLITNLNPDAPLTFSSDPDCFTSLGSKVLFRATRMQQGRHLWVTDGTALNTTRLVIGNAAIIDPIFTFNRIAYNGKLLFTATNGITGVELWITDGTQAGTRIVRDIYPGAGSSNPANFILYNNRVYFTASDGATGIELWRTDGTAAGTVLVKDLYIAQNSAMPADLTVCGGLLYFSAYSAYGRELFKYNGNDIYLCRDIYPGASSGDPQNLCAVGNTLFFTATDYANGRELWKADAAGTVLVKDINKSYTFGSNPQWLTNVNGTLCFSADDGVSGRELWKSNGTDAGTTRIIDLGYGKASGSPQWLKNTGNKLMFGAYGSSGAAPMYIRGWDPAQPTQVGQCSGVPCRPFVNFKNMAWTSAKTYPTLPYGEPMGIVPTCQLWSWGNIYPGVGSNPDNFTNASDVYLYLAATPASGVRRVYRTDGSWGSAGMVAIPSAAGYPAYSSPANLFCHHQ